MVCQSIAVPNACGVEQKGVENVLIYVGAFIIYKQAYTVKSKCILTYLLLINNYVFYTFDPPTCLPCMKEIWQRDTQFSRQRKCLPEVPKSPPTVLPANLQTTMLAQGKLNCYY